MAAPDAPSYIHTTVELVAMDDGRLHQLEDNPNVGDVVATAKSLARFGLRDPLVARRTHGDRGEIEAGNTRWDAVRLLRSHVEAITQATGRRRAKAVLDARQQLGAEAAGGLMDAIDQDGDQAWAHVGVMWVDEDAAEGMAFALASNRTGRLGHDDPLLLAQMLQRVAEHEHGLIQAASYTDDDLQLPEADPLDTSADDQEPTPDREPRQRTSRVRDDHEATSTRTLVLPMNVSLHAWTTSHLAAIRRDQGLDTDAAAIVWLLEQHVGGTAPRNAPGLQAIEEP